MGGAVPRRTECRMAGMTNRVETRRAGVYSLPVGASAPRAESVPEPEPRGPLLTVREILADPELSAPPEPIVPRLAYRGRTSMLAAREKAGKSTLASAGAAAVSTGTRFLGEQAVRGPVLWVGVEEALGDMANRLADFGCDQEDVFILDRVAEPMADVHTAVERVRPVLIVIDTLATFVSTLDLDPGSATAWTPVMAALTRLARDNGAALLLLHHARKSDGRYRDSTAIGAGVDLILEMDEGDGGQVRKVRGRGRWSVEDFSVRLADDRWTLESGELSLDTLVLLHVREHPGASTTSIRGGVRGKARLIDDAIARLVSRGAIVDFGDEKGHQYFVAGQGPGQGGLSFE